MTDSADESLDILVAESRKRINELRRANDPCALLDAAKAAAEEIEQRAGDMRNDLQRQALVVAQRFTYNAAADCWPGWSVLNEAPDRQNLLAASKLAKVSARLVKKLELGPLREGTGIWLCGALDLALGDLADAASAFANAHQHYLAGSAPGLALLTEGYMAIVRQIAGDGVAVGDNLEQINSKIAAGSFEDGAEWIEQLRTAQKVFAG